MGGILLLRGSLQSIVIISGQYIFEHQQKQPQNGTLVYNTILQLMLFCRREGKWDEVANVDLFFALRNHAEWHKECGMIPQDPMVLALEKEGGCKNLKRCCSACSISKRRSKCRLEEEEGDLG